MAIDPLPHWLSQAGLEILESSCNLLLQRDPITLVGLAGLNQLRLACQITDLDYGVLVLPHAYGLQLQFLTHTNAANAGLTGTLQQWLWLWRQPNIIDALNQLDIWGDRDGIIQLLNLLSALDIDLEGWLASQMGHLPARELSLSASAKLQSAQRLLQWVKVSATNFLQEEAQLLVSNTEHQHFATGVAELTQSLESLQQRIAKLAGQIA